MLVHSPPNRKKQKAFHYNTKEALGVQRSIMPKEKFAPRNSLVGQKTKSHDKAHPTKIPEAHDQINNTQPLSESPDQPTQIPLPSSPAHSTMDIELESSPFQADLWHDNPFNAKDPIPFSTNNTRKNPSTRIFPGINSSIFSVNIPNTKGYPLPTLATYKEAIQHAQTTLIKAAELAPDSGTEDRILDLIQIFKKFTDNKQIQQQQLLQNQINTIETNIRTLSKRTFSPSNKTNTTTKAQEKQTFAQIATQATHLPNQPSQSKPTQPKLDRMAALRSRQLILIRS
jgi:hypothetical protein